MTSLRLLVLTRYAGLGASSRLRFAQYFPSLQAEGIEVEWHPLFNDASLLTRYRFGQYGLRAVLAAYVQRIKAMLSRHTFDVIWIEAEAIPWCPLMLEAALLSGVPYVLDYDDAVFHNYDLHRSMVVRRWFGNRLDGLMARAALVVCGNDYLAQRAEQAGAPWVEQLPTVIDLARYTLSDPSVKKLTGQVAGAPRVVWIGSPSTAKYLENLRQPLQKLAQNKPFVLRVIGAQFNLPGVQVECLPWSEAAEVANIAVCDLGIMPLIDSSWERGKCGYKLIQYMACALPVVASDVGVNADIVQEGVNGYLVQKADSWERALACLLDDANLRQSMGLAGRQRVESEYCVQITGPKLTQWLMKAAQGN